MPGPFRALVRRLDGWVGFALTGLAVLGVLAVVWVPEVTRYRVSVEVPNGELLSALHTAPDNDVLDEITRLSLTGQPRLSDEEAIRAADGLVGGWYRPHGLPPVQVGPGFRPGALDAPSPTVAMLVAGLAPVEILVQAYRATGRHDYLRSASDYVAGFAAVERDALLPRGLLWNDHAIASRVGVLLAFWRVWRSVPAPDQEVERAALALLVRGAAQLAKPVLFNVATNHGVMQNIALLQAAIALPGLPERPAWLALAMRRLDVQFGFYVSPDGMILEHSAGYHQHGLTLLALASRLAQLGGQPVPPAWIEAHARAVRVLGALRRPDGTLPSFGNTSTRPEPAFALSGAGAGAPLAPLVGLRPEGRLSLLPVSGYAVVWAGLDGWPEAGRLVQSSVVWSNYEGHGHKHADETSMQLWASGREWISNVGYWPYGVPLYRQAVSWPGSNAPHWPDEGFAAVRATRLVGHGESEEGVFFDLERRNADGRAVRRQLVVLPDARWLVLDTSEDAQRRTLRTIWTAGPALEWVGNGGRFRAPAAQGEVSIAVEGRPTAAIAVRRASADPFAGWLVVDAQVVPASSVVVETPAAGWTFTGVAVQQHGGSSVALTDAAVVSDTEWGTTLVDSKRTTRLERKGNRVLVDGSVLALQSPIDVAARQLALRTAHRNAIAEYPKPRELVAYRLRVTPLIVAVGVVQEAVLLGLRLLNKSIVGLLRAIALAGWAILAAWIGLRYLV